MREITKKDIQFSDRYSCRLCKSWASPCFEKHTVDCETVASGREGLVMAANSFDESKKCSFEYWAKINIKKAIIDNNRERFGKRYHEEFFKSFEFYPFDHNYLGLSNDGIEKRVILKDLFNKRLTAGQKYRFYLRYFSKFNPKQMAYQDGVTPNSVYIIFHEIKKKICKMFDEISQ